MFLPPSLYSTDDTPDLRGKVIIVTGANTGVGKETAKALLSHNAKVYIAARNQEKADRAIQELKAETGNEGIFLKLDLADLKSVKAAAEEFMSKENKLDVLFNNAGVMMAPVADTTADGYDMQFGTNVLGHFYFTKLLLPALLEATKSSTDGTARVVNTSSSISMLPIPVDFNSLKDGPARRKRFSVALYNQSKLGNVFFSNEPARRYGDQGIVSVSLNPGNLDSGLPKDMNKFVVSLTRIIISPARDGALTQLWAGTSAEGASLNGKYLKPWARVGNACPLADDLQVATELWKWCEDQVANV